MADQGGGMDARVWRARYHAVRFTRGVGVELGSGPIKAFPHFGVVRLEADREACKDLKVDHWVESFNDLSAVKTGLDFVFIWQFQGDASQVLEQARHLLKIGGHLVAVGELGNLRVDRRVDDGSLQPVEWLPPQDQKTALVVRYGAIGDTLQAAAVLPELKAQGYRVVFNSEPIGEELLRYDPAVDEFWVQDRDQVPNQELPAYWMAIREPFDRYVNFCESVEGTLLTLPGRSNHQWPDSVRRKYCNKNYLEFMFDLAEIEFKPGHHFYPSQDETEEVDRFMAKIRADANKDQPLGAKSIDPFVILWAQAGSSIHKFYPHQDAVIARVMLEIPHARVILTGDHACQILEAGWQKEPRVIKSSGKIAIRTVLALAQRCHLVVGPETGVLNAVAYETNRKVIFLSHSTVENLTKHWINTASLASETTPCYPCHRLHYSREFCPENPKTGAAQCQYELAPYRVWGAVKAAYDEWQAVHNLLRAA